MRYPLQSPVVAGRKRFTSDELANLDVSCQAILTWRGITPITDAQHEQVCSLMAAAPDLLTALEIILSSTCGDVGDDGYEGCIRIEAKALEHARAAIAKATGGAK